MKPWLSLSADLQCQDDRLGLNAEGEAPSCPAFLLDLVPQGRGRKYLAQELKIDHSERHDLLLAQYGAFNPIGNLRFDTAVAFYQERASRQQDHQEQGFTLEAMLSRQDQFMEHIWLHAMLSAGTTGVQGAAPKFLLAQNAQGLWFADAALTDESAAKHWLVKLPRGSHETDYAVLRNEAAYLRVAALCGVRLECKPQFHQDMLFVERFDRRVDRNGLQRLHQESLASLCGIRDFGFPASLFDLMEALRRHVTDPVGEAVEFIKRDILNMALRNTDNHARNTAVQRLPDGTIRLTPLFDFAPMYLDREFIVRGCKWRSDNGQELADWEQIIAATGFSEAAKHRIAGNIKVFQTVVEGLTESMRESGVDATVIEDCKRSIDAQVSRLQHLEIREPKEAGNGPTPQAD